MSICVREIVCTTRNKRKYKNKPQLIRWVAVSLLFMMGLVLSVLISDCAVYATYRKRSNNIVLVFDNILKIISPLYAILNAARQYVWDPEVKLRGMLTHDYILYLIRNINDHIRSFEDYKELLGSIVDPTEMERVDEILFADVCVMATYFNTIDECYDLTLDYGQQGIIVVLVRYLSMVRDMLKEYEENRVVDPSTSVYKFLNALITYKICNGFV